MSWLRPVIALCGFLVMVSMAFSSQGDGARLVAKDLDSIPKATLFSVLTLAKDVVEGAKSESSQNPNEVRNEAVRFPLRYRVALTIRKTGYEPLFDDYVARAISAWELWDPHRFSPLQELLRQNDRLTADARLAFFSGDLKKAERLLRDRPCEPIPVGDYCMLPGIAVHIQFLNWELEVGRMSAALRRLSEPNWIVRESNWTAEDVKTAYVRKIAEAFTEFGRVQEAIAFLSALRPRSGLERISIAQTYWRIGAVEDGRRLMREAAGVVLVEAEADANEPLPAWVAIMQLAMGDKWGGIATLRRLREFEETRVRGVQAQLARGFAFADLDAEAFAMLTDGAAPRSILPDIVAGQARRGDFEMAFRTLDQLRALPPAPPLTLRDIGPGTATTLSAVISILRNAARTGDASSFERAVAVYRELYPRGTWRGPVLLRDLARAGQVAVALDYAFAERTLEEKVVSLCAVAEGLAGFPDLQYDPLALLDTW